MHSRSQSLGEGLTRHSPSPDERSVREGQGYPTNYQECTSKHVVKLAFLILGAISSVRQRLKQKNYFQDQKMFNDIVASYPDIKDKSVFLVLGKFHFFQYFFEYLLILRHLLPKMQFINITFRNGVQPFHSSSRMGRSLRDQLHSTARKRQSQLRLCCGCETCRFQNGNPTRILIINSSVLCYSVH